MSFAPVINPPAPETMIERMARALCQCDEQDGAAPWDWYDDKGKDRYRASARAVLAVMREPTDAMEMRGGAAGDHLNAMNGDARDIYSAMIDVELEEQG